MFGKGSEGGGDSRATAKAALAKKKAKEAAARAKKEAKAAEQKARADTAWNRYTYKMERKEVMDDEKMDLLYQLGCVLDSMDKKEESIEQFKQIYERDIGYKDVADRVDAYYMSLG